MTDSRLRNLCVSQNAVASVSRRLAISVGIDHSTAKCQAGKICRASDVPTTTAAASVAAALGAL